MQTSTSLSALSADGTRIALERVGDGPPLILVEAAGHYREVSSFAGLVPLLARDFTVYGYDRRGRGESADTLPYAPDREVEDLEAVIATAGGTASVYGYSSGALLALQAAAHGLQIPRLAVLEPPLRDDDAESPDPTTQRLIDLVDAGRRSDAVELFHESIGVPSEFIAQFRATPDWQKMVSIAHTLAYDCLISEATTPTMLRSVEAPTLVLDSQGSTDDLTGWAASVADQLPQGSHRSLPGEWHGVADDVLAPALIDFFQVQ